MFSGAKPDWSTEGKDWPYRAASTFVEAGGVRWHVQRYGAGPSILLVHGTGAATHSWAPLGALLESDFRIIAPDLPGHGFSSTPAYRKLTLPGMSEALGALLAELGEAPDYVLGHSAGGAILIRMIADGRIAPRAGLVVNGALAAFPGLAGFMFPAMAKLLYLNPLVPAAFAHGAQKRERVLSLIRGTGSEPPPDIVDRYAALMRRAGHVAGALGMMAAWDVSTLDALLPELRTPLLFAAGARDKAVPPSVSERAAGRARSGAFALLDGAGHLAHEERPDLVADLVKRLARGNIGA